MFPPFLSIIAPLHHSWNFPSFVRLFHRLSVFSISLLVFSVICSSFSLFVRFSCCFSFFIICLSFLSFARFFPRSVRLFHHMFIFSIIVGLFHRLFVFYIIYPAFPFHYWSFPLYVSFVCIISVHIFLYFHHLFLLLSSILPFHRMSVFSPVSLRFAL